MRDVAADTGLHDVHRLSAEEYHQLIESGGLNEDTRVELIDGLLLDMSPKSPAHEHVIAWLNERLILGVDLARYQVRPTASLSLGDSEPEPDLTVVERSVATPYHPATAVLVVEVAVSSQRRDLRVKPRIYAAARVPVYWVIDVDGGRAVMHSEPTAGEYERVEVVTELAAPHIGLSPIALADVLAAAGG
jgi:Uma2 family endonuclease